MFSKNTHVVRGHSSREVELKVNKFIYVRDTAKDEEWEAEDVQYAPARMIGYKPWFCVINRVKSDV